MAQDDQSGHYAEYEQSVELMITDYVIIPYADKSIAIEFTNIFGNGDRFLFGLNDIKNIRNALTTAIEMVEEYEG